MSTQDCSRFTLAKWQVNDFEDNLLLDGAQFTQLGIEQPDGMFQFDLSREDLQDLAESLAAACHSADDEHAEVRLDTIFRMLVRVLEG